MNPLKIKFSIRTTTIYKKLLDNKKQNYKN
jgi:hypothetical protein